MLLYSKTISMQKNIFFILASIATFLFGIQLGFANGLQLPEWAQSIADSSIKIGGEFWQSRGVDEIRRTGFSFLMLAKVIISGFALIYIVLIGAYMVIYSEDESTIAKQKMQIMYAMIGFLFLNIPTLIYDVFVNPDAPNMITNSWTSNEQNGLLWNGDNLAKFWDALMKFFRVLVFIVAVGMFTWSAFTLIISRGKDEYKKNAFNRFLYGSASLIFLGIAEVWINVISQSDFSANSILWDGIAGQIFNFLFFLAGPVAVFFLIVWAYYYITSAGNEDRAKKWKAIVINTAIATVILLASFSFVSEISNFF